MPVFRYRSIEEMPRPWREPDDPENLRLVAQMMAFYRRLTRAPHEGPRVQRFRSFADANAHGDDLYRRSKLIDRA